MWWDHVRLESMITPRNVKHVTRSIGIWLIITLEISVVFSILCLLLKIIIFDIFIFRDSLFTVIQSNTFVNSAFICMEFGFVIWLSLKSSNVLSRVVSSAYMMGVNVSLAMARSSIYIKKRRGPNIDPWGTPVVIISVADWVLLNSTYCFLSDK